MAVETRSQGSFEYESAEGATLGSNETGVNTNSKQEKVQCLLQDSGSSRHLSRIQSCFTKVSFESYCNFYCSPRRHICREDEPQNKVWRARVKEIHLAQSG